MRYGFNICERDIFNPECLGVTCYFIYSYVQTQISLNDWALNPIKGVPLPKLFTRKIQLIGKARIDSLNTRNYCRAKI